VRRDSGGSLSFLLVRKRALETEVVVASLELLSGRSSKDTVTVILTPPLTPVSMDHVDGGGRNGPTGGGVGHVVGCLDLYGRLLDQFVDRGCGFDSLPRPRRGR